MKQDKILLEQAYTSVAEGSGTLTTNHKNTMQTENDTSKPETELKREAVDLHRLVRLLRGRDRHYNAGELMTMAADAIDEIIRQRDAHQSPPLPLAPNVRL